MIRNPGLIWALNLRKKSLSARVLGEGYFVGSGARIAYWGWLPDHPSKGNSTRLQKTKRRDKSSPADGSAFDVSFIPSGARMCFWI